MNISRRDLASGVLALLSSPAFGITQNEEPIIFAKKMIIKPNVNFSPSSRSAGSTYRRVQAFYTTTTFAIEGQSGVATDALNPSPFANSGDVYEVPGATMTFLFHGDSITYGFGSQYGVYESFVDKFIRGLFTTYFQKANYKNRGIIGQGLNYAYTTQPRVSATLTADAASQIDAAKIAGTTNYCVIFAGTNDIWLNSTTGAATWALLSSYISARISAGFTPANILVCTCLPRGDNSKATDIGTYNSSIRSNAGTLGFTVVDFAADSIMGNSSNLSNTSWYVDTIHPTMAGHARLANILLGIVA